MVCYEAVCVGCGHFLYDSVRSELERAIIRHCMKSHSRDVRYRIRRISRERFLAHIAFEHDPRYWDAIRNANHFLTARS